MVNRKEQLIDEFVSSLSRIIEIKDDIHLELRYHNSRQATIIKEERYHPEVESLKSTLNKLLSISIESDPSHQ